MQSRLDAYLEELSRSMRGLPRARRAEELREMEAHLYALVEARRELGYTADEAVEGSLRQFGEPRRLGRGLVWAWYRRRLAIPGATACAIGWTVVFAYLYSLTGVTQWMADSGNLAIQRAACAVHWSVLALLVGLGTGLVAPRRAVAGTALWVGFDTVVNTFSLLKWALAAGEARPHAWLYALANIAGSLTALPVAVLAARWAARRRGGSPAARSS